jgi:hypothetical protein
MEKFTTGIGLIFAGIAILVVAAVLMAWPVQLLWNGCLIGAVDGVHPIGFWQAMGLNFLFGILFKASASSSKK